MKHPVTCKCNVFSKNYPTKNSNENEFCLVAYGLAFFTGKPSFEWQMSFVLRFRFLKNPFSLSSTVLSVCLVNLFHKGKNVRV